MSSIKPPVKKGDVGINVKRLQAVLIKQKFLAEKLPNGKPSLDGDFRGVTEAAVKLFQSTVGLPATGVADSATLQKLIPYRTAVVTTQVATASQPTAPAKGQLSAVPRLVPELTLPPAKSPTTPTPSTGKGWVFQPQAGPQYLFKPPWYTLPQGASTPPPSLSLQLQFWLTYRTASEGFHLEVAAGPSMSYDFKFHADDPTWTIAGNVSIMAADIFAPGSFHLLSPQLQFGVYNNRDGSFDSVSSGLALNFGNQMSYEIVKDKLMFILTPGFWVQYDFKSGQWQGTPGGSFAFGGSF